MKKKIDGALALITEASMQHQWGLFCGHSGGKDSCVIHHLAKQVDPDIRVIHTSKPVEKMFPETLEFLYYTVCQETIINFVPTSEMEMYVLRNHLTLQVDGSRRDEATRSDRSTDYVVDGKNVNRADMDYFVKDGLFGLSILYPIYDWTDAEVWQYIKDNKIPVSKEYNL